MAVSQRKEQLQVGYLHAIAAAAGCTVATISPDVWGIDCQVDHPSSKHKTDPTSPLRIQLKATSTILPSQIAGKSQFSFRIPNSKLAQLNPTVLTINRILVVMLVPDKPEDWIVASPNSAAVHHAAYWVNLSGVQLHIPTKPVKNPPETTIQVPTSADHVFDDVNLCHIMERIGQGGTP